MTIGKMGIILGRKLIIDNFHYDLLIFNGTIEAVCLVKKIKNGYTFCGKEFVSEEFIELIISLKNIWKYELGRVCPTCCQTKEYQEFLDSWYYAKL